MSLFNVFDITGTGMSAQSVRLNTTASNIANADTPGYKAKGMDFKKALAQASTLQQSSGMKRTNEKHFDTRMELNNGVDFRIPTQPDTGDGNTVDVQKERNMYLANSLEYQASVEFLNGRIKGLKKAITGTGQ